MVRKDEPKILVTPSYIKKTITIRPDKDNQVFTFKQVKDFVNKKLKTLPANANAVVTGLSILRQTTLKGYHEDFMTEDEYDEYARGRVEDSSKFSNFRNFTITVRMPNDGSLFKKYQK